MSTITDEMVEADWSVIRSCGQPVGAGDGDTYIRMPPDKAAVKRALEAAERARIMERLKMIETGPVYYDSVFSEADRERYAVKMTPALLPSPPEGKE